VASHAADVERLQQELADARTRLDTLVREGADTFAARRIAELEEARQVARGQALEAAAARSRAEAELRALRDAIERAPGLRGRLVRWAVKRLAN
jgi:uncharacterized protein (UPF0264 family)